MKEMKRILALVLCFAMLVGFLPAFAFEAKAATGDVIDAAIFCSDVHNNPSTVTSIFNGIKSADSTFAPSTASFVGDTQCASSSVTTAAQSVYSGVECIYAFGNHDDEGNYGIEDYTGLSYGDSTTNYYIYTISENDMADSSPDTDGFTSTVDGLDKSKPLFIISHMPLHDRRDDNYGASAWYTAISAAAEKMDIFFFWAHNHTSEGDADRAAYYVAKDGSETMTIYGGSTVTPNFTYANAGYIDPPNNPTRNNVATAVRIYADSVNLTVYDEDGVYSGSYAVNETVTREFAAAAVTLSSITISGTNSYTVGDELDLTVTAAYSDGKTADVTESVEWSDLPDMNTAGTYTVTATYEGLTATYTIAVADPYITGIAITTLPTTTTFKQGDEFDSTGLVVTATYNNGTTAEVTPTSITGYDMSAAGEQTVSVNYYVNGTTWTATYKITVYEALADDVTLTGLEITSDPATTEYLLNDALDITGMVVTATFSDGSTKELTYGGFINTDEASSVASDTFCYYIDGFNMYVGKEQEVVVSYTYGDVTLTDTFVINVWNYTVSDDTIGVQIELSDADYGVTGVTVGDSENENVATAITEYISGTNYKAYNISLTLDEDYTVTNGTKAVTLPIPEGVTNPVVCYVSEDGVAEKMTITSSTDTTVTFETTHFSTYVVGESTELVLDAPKTETVEGSGGTTYVYTSTATADGSTGYILVSNGYALMNNSGNISYVAVTVNDDGSLTIPSSVTLSTLLWTIDSDGDIMNDGYYLLRQSGSGSKSMTISTTDTGNAYSNWTYANDTLTVTGGQSGSTTYYAYYNTSDSAFYTATSSQELKFYGPTESSVSGTYSIAGNPEEVTKVVANGSTATLGYTITFTPDEGTASTVTDLGGTVTWSEVDGGDPNEVLTIAANGTVTFSGTNGKAVVKVSYTWTDDDDNEYTIDNYVTINATEPYYDVQLHYAELTEVASDATFDSSATYYIFNSTTNVYEQVTITEFEDDVTYYTTPVVQGEEIDEIIALKGVEAGDRYPVWAVVKLYDGTDDDGTDLGDLDDSRLMWVVSDTSIATIDESTGVLTFTGDNYGTFQVTVYYLDEDGDILCEDTITISATETLYTLPEDGTNDFPEYPDQGAIRFDKTAVAQGNFSETGIAMVELSMTGVPYGTNVKTDVVIMVDMTASMSDDDVTAAELAVQELIEHLVYDEENDKYDSNIQIFLDVFYSASDDSDFETEEYMAGTTISSAAELTAAKALVNFTQSSNGGGTRYNLAMKDVYETLTRDGHADNQYVVFVSDGVPTAYAPLTDGALGTTITGSNSETASLADGWFDLETGAVTDDFETEYYSYMIKTAGIPIYTVGCNLTALTEPALVLDHMSSNYSADGKTATGETKYSFFCTTSNGITDEVLEIFAGIGEDIREAATEVTVEDKIDSHYTVSFKLPNTGVTAEEAGMSEFYIQAVSYTLDENNERSGDPTVIEKFTFNADGTLKEHLIGSTTCSNCSDEDTTNDCVTFTDGVVTAINGTYFTYSIDANGDEFLTWEAEKLDRNELALQYFVYLDDSAGLDADAQVDPGTYPTNEYATLTYKNFNGKWCQQEFPVPTMTWMGAQVTYVFYLVNEDGQPVNRAGRVVPFAESIYVTDPVTYDVTWNELTGTENILAENIFATAGVPDVYQLYDEEAQYVIRVYQTETVDSNGKNGNYFQISGSSDKLIDSALDTDTTVDNSTTVVFNTKAGKKYDSYGYYSIYSTGTTLTDGTNDITTNFQATDIDYANTTVAFAVVWKPELVPDTVVLDYGLDVVIDVATNDTMAAGVTGVSTSEPDVTMNSGTYKTAAMGTSADVQIDDLTIGTATVESLTSVRFSLDKTNGMQFNAPVEFFYESECNYYTYDASGNRTLNTAFMYSKVTVIPATTIYYEDEYVTLTTHTLQEDGTYAVTSGWTSNSTAASATQAQDRPGESKISADLDADNNYGYDAAYSDMSTYSMGSAAMVNVYAGKYATATFDFYGTGFDVISLTDTTTGTIFVKVADADGNSVKNVMVDTYYGYVRNYYQVTYTYTDGAWVVKEETKVTTLGDVAEAPENPTEGQTYTTYETRWETTTSNDPNALYQVPVIKVEDLDYGKYTVTITASYVSSFDNVEGSTSYDFYLDAIRIYDPTGNLNDDANEAYVADGEGWPTYFEVRNQIIDAATFESVETDAVNGIVFIDGIGNTASISDYTSYGPNNETYLAPGQAITFDLNATAVDGTSVAKVQLAVKTVSGTASIKVYSTDGTTALDADIATATDMYYDITALNGKSVVIMNDGDSGVLSITNVKITYTGEQTTDETETASVFMLRRSSVDAALATMSVEEEETETTEPETTVPEETEPETTVPEETEPSVEEKVEEAIKEVKKVIKKIFGWLFG